MVRDRRPPTVVPIAFVIGYAFGALGWLWDDLEYLGVLRLGFGAAPAHLLMSVSTLFMLATLAFGLQRFVGRLPAYGVFLAGLALSYVHPVLGTVVLLVLPVVALRFSLPRGQRMLWAVVTATGVAIVLVGGPWTGPGTGRIRALAQEICFCCPVTPFSLPAGW